MKNAGTLDLARAAIAKRRAPGQIAPSKYLPGVPRQVHAAGGKVDDARADFLAGNHPEVPPVVYHSTKGDFREFRPMSHFGTEKAAHERYHNQSWHPAHLETSRKFTDLNIIPAHISLKNPIDVGSEREWQSNRDTLRQVADWMGGKLDKKYAYARQKLKDLVDDPRWGDYPHAMEQRGADIIRDTGHDGIIYTNTIEDPGSRSFITLGPEQVKSAISAREFDPENPDMTKAEGGAITKADGGSVEGAETVARMLREGRASEITNEHLDAADPQHLWKLYETGQTGMDMPMDAKSRATRAKELGFTSKEFHGTTTGGEMRYPSPNYGSGSREGIGFVTSSNPHVASSYADPKFGSVFPMLNRDQNLANIDAKGEVWSGIPEEAEVALPGGAKTTVGRYASGRADMGGVHDTNQIARGARIEGDGGVRISNLLDRSIHVPDDRNDPSLRTEFQQKSSMPSDVTFRHDTRGIRSIFARFDPRLAHLSHLNASTGGKMENPDMTKAEGGAITKGDGGGITAYHGGPYDFDAFDISRIGTGEGAQAYGHGLYFAGNENIARHYRDALSDKDATLGSFKNKDGSDLDVLYTPNGLYSLLKDNEPKNTSYESLINSANDKLQWAQSRKGPMRDIHSKDAQNVLDFLKANEGLRFEKNPAHGHMYKVNLNVGPHELLDWDAPLSQQPAWQKVRQNWDNTKGDPDIIADRLGLDENSTGQDLHRALSGPNQINAAIALSEAGIKGIRYLDAGSRGDTDEPTYNYVMFHHDPVKIVDKYAYGGDVDNKPIDLNFERARKNVASGDLPQHVQNTFARLAERNRAQLAAHQEAMQAGAFDDTQIGDEYRAPAGTTFKITNHFMMPADRWGGREPPSMVYQGHVPMVSTVYTDPKMKGFDMNRAVEHVKQMERIGGPLRVVKAGGGAADGYVPQKTVKAYKLFRTKGDGKLYSLFVHADNPVETGKWLEAEEGPQGKTQGKVKSKIGDLAHRPGWHAGDLPIATHIGGKSDPSLNKPDYRPDNHVWAEVEIAADHDWQSEADSRGRGVKAHITDQVPLRGFYRYKTNPNMTGNWLIGGHMKVNRVLSDDEVKAINDAAGVADLPRLSRVAKAGGGGTGDNGDAPVNLGVHRFHRQLNSDVQSTMNDMVDAHQKALKAGVFDGYEVGDKLQGQVGGPLTVKARYMAKWKPGGASDKTIQRMGQIPTLMDHNGVTYHPMLRLTGADGSEGDYPLDAVRGYPKFTGLRVVKKNGGGVKLYSKAAQIIRGLAKPEDNAEEMVRIALEKGAKKAELQHADVAPGMASRDRVADYIEAVQPRIGVQKLGSHDAGLTDEERDELGYLKSMMPHRISVENIQRIIELENKKSSSAKYEEYQLPGGENYREHVLTLDSHSHNDPYYARNHWGKMKNPLAHIRMSDRAAPSGMSPWDWINARDRMMKAIGVTDPGSLAAGAPDAAVAKGAITPEEARAIAVDYGWTGSKYCKPRKILHVEELQSDWNSDARRKGFRTGTEQEDYDNFVKDMRQKAKDMIDATPMVKRELEKKYDEMDPYRLAGRLRMDDEYNQLYRRAKFPGPPQAPYINPKSDDWAELALKHVLHEAAQGGYDGITFTPDAEQSKRWRGTDFNDMYDKKFPGIAARLVKQHDPSINPSTMQITQGVQGPMIPLTEQARRGILENGFSSFKKGGYVR